MDQTGQKLGPAFISGAGNTSGERDAEIVIAIVGMIVVDISTLAVEVTDIHQVAIRIVTRSCLPPSISLPLRVIYKVFPLYCRRSLGKENNSFSFLSLR